MWKLREVIYRIGYSNYMSLLLRVFLQLIHQSIYAFNEIRYMTNIEVLRVITLCIQFVFEYIEGHSHGYLTF